MLGQDGDRLLAEVIKLRAWHANSLELIGQQAEIIREANNKLKELQAN
jgi:hypothetical protein